MLLKTGGRRGRRDLSRKGWVITYPATVRQYSLKNTSQSVNPTSKLTMKNLLAFFLFCVGAIVCVTCRAETLLADEKVYKSTTAPDGIQHVRIEGGSYFFKPSRVIVRVNIPVELAVSVDSGVVPHSLVIQAPEAGVMVDERLSPATKIVRFTATKTGKYPFYCNNKLLFFKSHREKGGWKACSMWWNNDG